MRGKDIAFVNPFHFFRITPAYAGKRSGDMYTDSSDSGSPPPMRGKAGKN